MAIYMQIPGIKGDATQGKHVDWIVLQSVENDVARKISTPVGAGQNREAAEPEVNDIIVTKKYDSSSVLLFQEATVGLDAKTPVLIHFCRTDQQGDAYLEYELTNVLFSKYAVSGDPDDRPTETSGMNFTKIAINEQGPNLKNGNGQPVKAQYNIATASKS